MNDPISPLGPDKNLKDNKQTTEEKWESAQDPKSSTSTAAVPNATPDEQDSDSEKNERSEQQKILREWLTIIGLFLAAGAAIYQGHILSKQADTLNGQLAQMVSSSAQTDKLIQSNADLAAAAKAQSIAEQQSAAIAHDTLTMNQRARISVMGASFDNLQSGKPLKTMHAYGNLGKEPTPVSIRILLRKWSLPEWNNGVAHAFLKQFQTECAAQSFAGGTTMAYPSTGFGNGYRNSSESNDEALPESAQFLVDDDIISGNTVVSTLACYTYETVSETHHTSSCFFYIANKTPNISTLNICSAGNGAD